MDIMLILSLLGGLGLFLFGIKTMGDGLEQAAAALHLSEDRNAAMEKGRTVAQVYMAVASALTDTDSSLSLTLDGLDVSVSIQSPEESRMTREKLLDLEHDPSSASAISSMMSSASIISSSAAHTHQRIIRFVAMRSPAFFQLSCVVCPAAQK